MHALALNSGVQAGDVQSKSVLNSHYRRGEGTEEGEMSVRLREFYTKGM